MRTNKNSILWVIVVVSLFPLVLWLLAPAAQPRFSTGGAILASFGQMFGLVGVVLFAINLLLSARLRFFEARMNGLNNVYTQHSLIGQIAFILLLFHPLLLISKYATSVREAASFLWLSNDWSINWGILALGCMIALIVLTLYLRPRYDIWKWTHKFLGGAFFLAALHIWLIPSDTSRYLPLKAYVLAFVALGLIAFVYRSVLGRFLIQKHRYRVTRVMHLNNEVTELQMEPENERLVYGPGQFVFLNFIDHTIGFESHPFSLTSSPNDKHISVSIKDLGDYTSKIHELAPGILAEVEGPFGRFSYEHLGRAAQTWIAGGIGITPFISMVRSLTPESGYTVDLFYCVKNKEEAVYLDMLTAAAAALNNVLRIIPFFSDEQGRITADLIQKASGNVIEKDILICAPPPMIHALKDQFASIGANREHIYSEEFSL